MTLNKSKQNTNQNLIPDKLIYTYLYQRTLVPAIIVVIIILFVAAGGYFFMKWKIEDFNQKSMELASQDLSSTNVISQNLLNEKEAQKAELNDKYTNYFNDNPIHIVVNNQDLLQLEEEIQELKHELAMWEEKQNAFLDTPVDVNAKYHIEDLIMYIDKIRTKNLAIVSLEDTKSETGSDKNNGDGYLIYDEDIGKVSFSLHGMATSASEVSKFCELLEQCEYVASASILSVETQSVQGGPSVYVFEVKVTPKVG